jgi:hypothetical protein
MRIFLKDAQRLRVRGQHLLPLARRRRLPALHGPDVHRGTPPLSRFSFNYLDPCLSLLTLPQLGVNWAATLLGSVGLLLAPSPFLFYKYGARIRARSTFAHCTDLKVAQIIADEKAVV